jgi:hypothetical protein
LAVFDVAFRIWCPPPPDVVSAMPVGGVFLTELKRLDVAALSFVQPAPTALSAVGDNSSTAVTPGVALLAAPPLSFTATTSKLMICDVPGLGPIVHQPKAAVPPDRARFIGLQFATMVPSSLSWADNQLPPDDVAFPLSSTLRQVESAIEALALP